MLTVDCVVPYVDQLINLVPILNAEPTVLSLTPEIAFIDAIDI